MKISKFFIMLGVLFLVSLGIYLFSTPHESDIPLTGIVTGNDIIVSPQLPGRMIRLTVDEGSEVHKGDLIAELDPAELEAARDAAAANIRSLEAKVKSVQETRSWTNDQTSASLQQAQSNLTATRAQLDQARSQMTLANVSAPNQIAISKANLQSKQADVQAKQADVDRAQLDLSYCKIVSPVAGVVSKRVAEVGEHVSKGQRLLTLADLGDLWVTANFKESQLKQMHAGQSVTVAVDAYDEKFDGTVEAMPGATGSITSLLPPENASGNYVKVVQRLPVRIRLKAGQQGLDRLRPGMSVVPKVWLK